MSIKMLERVLSSELSLGHVYLLSLIKLKNSVETNNILINGWLNALIKKNLIIRANNNYELTEKGKEDLSAITHISSSTVEERQEKETIEIKNDLRTLSEFSAHLHTKIVERIKKLTDKSNFKNPSGKMLNSSVIELHERLIGFFKKYKNVDAPYDKIERAILKYVEDTCTGNNKYAVRIIFFIWNEKNGGKISEMLERIENLEDEVVEVKKQINTKELF